MGIKVSTGGRSRPVTYPFLGSSDDGRVVLFHKAGCGVVLIGNRLSKVGEYSISWSMGKFTPHKGSLEITNE